MILPSPQKYPKNNKKKQGYSNKIIRTPQKFIYFRMKIFLVEPSALLSMHKPLGLVKRRPLRS